MQLGSRWGGQGQERVVEEGLKGVRILDPHTDYGQRCQWISAAFIDDRLRSGYDSRS